MPCIPQPVKQPPIVEERLHELNVHEMRAAEIGVVDDIDVTRLGIARDRNDRLGGFLHRSDENRQAKVALRNQFAVVPVINPVRSVLPFRNDRTKRRSHECQIHFVANLLQAVLDDT